MLKVIVNNQQNFEIENTANALTINGEPFVWDLLPLGENRFHILHNNRSYNAEVLEANVEEKTFKLKINDAVYTIAAKDRFDLLLEQMGIGNTAKNKVNQIKAPMPGLIWEIKVQVGDVVRAGDVALVLVAMKMENALKSPGEGTVKAIKVTQGDTVDKNEVLIEFE